MSNEYPLHAAVMDNNLEEVKSLLALNPTQVNTPDEGGDKPLNLAIRYGYYGIACRLVEHGATLDPDLLKQGAMYESGLHEAARYNKVEQARFYILAGIDINAPDGNGNTSLHIACVEDSVYEAEAMNHTSSQEWKAEMVEFLLQHGADCWRWNKEGRLPLWYALFSKNFQSVKLLVEHGAELWSWLLHEACRINDEDIVEFLLSQGCDAHGRYDPNDPDAPRHTALHTLCKCSEVDAYNCSRSARIAKLLLTHGADVNARDERGQTPLFHAFRGGCLELWQALVEYRGGGMDVAGVVNVQDHSGNTPRHFLLAQDKTEHHSAALQWLSLLSGVAVYDKDAAVHDKEG